MAAGCERSFMRKADLVSHAQNHTGTVHKCDQCEYSAMDIRYLKQHQVQHLRQRLQIFHSNEETSKQGPLNSSSLHDQQQ